MHIRDVAVDPPLILAPMEGVTDITFRRLVRGIGGVGLVCTEFIPASGLAEDIERCRALAELDEDEHPVTIQVYGREPEALAAGARAAQALGADIVDLNMGCPSKKVCAHSGGSALMKEPELARAIVRAIRAAVDVPFTVKMRSGWDPAHKNAPELAWMCQEEGAEAVTVHWRTRADLYGGERELDTVAEVKRRLSIPVVFNGDIVDVDSAREAFVHTGCDALMIGRGAIRNPWVFQQIRHALFDGPAVVVDASEKERVLLGYFDAILHRFRSEKGALGRWKKISKHFTDGLPHGALLKDDVLHAQSVAEARDRVAAFFERLRAWEAGDADAFASRLAS
ncbi:MAG: tRNA-dihydrouridine synthase [Alphaproteobacteria bacterium]|nr:tRNA-dihydrouridine synthase [Alphaproteobacteria bacterium]